MAASAILAILASLPQTDSADFAEGLSSKLLGLEREVGEEEDTEAKVRNPVTGRWIRFQGPTYTKLVKQGILIEGEEDFKGQSRLSLDFDYKKKTPGEAQGISPREGSAAIVHYCCRLYGENGPIVATSVVPAQGEGAQRALE